MKNFYRVAQGVDITPLNIAIARRPEIWKEDTYLRDYPQGPFGDVETIMLRFPVKGVFETEKEVENHLSTYDMHESIDYPMYKTLTEARPIVMSLMARVEGERLGRVMINKICPGGVIFPHADTPAHAEYYSRFHAARPVQILSLSSVLKTACRPLPSQFSQKISVISVISVVNLF